MESIHNGQSRIQLERLLATHYQHPNLAEAERFFTDFGLQVARRDQDQIYFRGFGADPFVYIAQQSPDTHKHFVGGIWLVRSETDLELATQLPRASVIQKSSAPGGGKYTELEDPVGFKVTLVHGIEIRSNGEVEKETPSHVTINSWIEKPRKGVFQRFDRGPSWVHKSGHYGVVVADSKYEEMLEWYLGTFSLAVTDTIYNPKTGKDFMAQLHIDRGNGFVDHHSFFLEGSSKPLDNAYAHHTGFEVDNFDSQMTGHDWLNRKGWTNAWGIGRHKLGSQIFDYWFDASGNMVKHYSDGDLVNGDEKAKRNPASPETMFTWGPMPPMAFLTGRVEDAMRKA